MISRPRWLGPELLAVVLLLAVSGLPRLIALEADPPLRISAVPLTDEGWWAQSARQHTLFGRWVMDEHNPALYVTPVYTLALRGVYAAVGVGIWQTRLVSALSGILTCLALYAGLRAVLPRRRALPPALLLALSLMAVTMNRIAFTESLQLLLVTIAIGGVLWSARYPLAAAAGGIALALALLCKPNVVILLPVIAGYWAGELWAGRGGPSLRRRLRPALVFSATVLVMAVAVALFIAPHWTAIRDQLAISLANVYGANVRAREGGAEFFFLPWLGLRASGFSSDSLVPLLGLGVLVWRRLTRSGVTPADAAERVMWWWLGLGLLWLAIQPHQPDRRFLLFMVPLAVLGWRGLVEEGVRILPGTPQAGLLRHLLAGLTCGALAGLVALGYLAGPLRQVLTALRLGGPGGVSAGAAQQFVWHGAAAVMVVGAALLWRWGPRRGRAVSAWIWLPVWLVLEPAQLLRDQLHATFTLRDGAHALAEIAGRLPPERRVVTGDLANTMALESDLFAFVIRDNRETGPAGAAARLNLDGWERFRPALLLSLSREGPAARRFSGYPGPDNLHGFHPLCSFATRRRPDGRLFEVTIWLAPELSLPVSCPPGSRPGL